MPRAIKSHSAPFKRRYRLSLYMLQMVYIYMEHWHKRIPYIVSFFVARIPYTAPLFVACFILYAAKIGTVYPPVCRFLSHVYSATVAVKQQKTALTCELFHVFTLARYRQTMGARARQPIAPRHRAEPSCPRDAESRGRILESSLTIQIQGYPPSEWVAQKWGLVFGKAGCKLGICSREF